MTLTLSESGSSINQEQLALAGYLPSVNPVGDNTVPVTSVIFRGWFLPQATSSTRQSEISNMFFAHNLPVIRQR